MGLKTLSALRADMDFCRPADLLRMGIPPSEAAGVRTEVFPARSRRLPYFLSALAASIRAVIDRVPVAEGLNGVERHFRRLRDILD